MAPMNAQERTCPRCGRVVHATATNCPGCAQLIGDAVTNVGFAPPRPTGASGSGNRLLRTLLIGCGGLILLAILLVVGLMIYFGANAPGETWVMTGREVTKDQIAELSKLAPLESGEAIKYFYCDGITSLAEGVYVATDRRLILYVETWSTPLTTLSYDSIKDLKLVSSDTWINDSTAIVTTRDGEEITFPLSSEREGDQRFVNYVSQQAKLPKGD